MERNHGSGILDWFRRHFGQPKGVNISYSRCNQTQACGACLKSSTSSNEAGSTSCVSDCTACIELQSSDSLRRCSSLSQPQSSAFASALSAPFRWTFRYDVCVCHSEKNASQAQALVLFLESPSKGLRCYLQPRDCPLGGALPSELFKAVRGSHCWVLLVSPDFLRDDWCLYQMHQAICEGPMSQRIIPAVVDMAVSEVPHELRFFYAVDLSRNTDLGYDLVYRTVLQYLKDKAEEHSSESGSCSAAGGYVEV